MPANFQNPRGFHPPFFFRWNAEIFVKAFSFSACANLKAEDARDGGDGAGE